MRRLLVLASAVLVGALPAAAQELVAVSTLLTQPDEYDQRVVTVRGELVGDYGERGDVTWVQVNDDPYVDTPLAESGRLAGTNTGIGVRIPGSIPDSFGGPGGHGTRGPIVEVTGVFRDLDPELGGLTFIEAVTVDLIEPAQPLPEPGIDVAAAVTGGVLTLAGLALLAHRRDLLPRAVPRS